MFASSGMQCYNSSLNDRDHWNLDAVARNSLTRVNEAPSFNSSRGIYIWFPTPMSSNRFRHLDMEYLQRLQQVYTPVHVS